MGESHEQAGAGALTSRKRFDPGLGVEIEGLPQFLGISLIPIGKEGLGVPHQLADAHPVGQLAVFGEGADAAEGPHGIGDRVEAEDAHGPRLRLEQPQDVLDDGRLAGSVAADQAEDTAARDRQREVIEGGLVAELPGHAANVDDGRRGGGEGVVHGTIPH
jgi:hypothetical protein